MQLFSKTFVRYLFCVISILSSEVALSQVTTELKDLKTKLERELQSGSCLSTLPLSRRVFELEPDFLPALKNIAECTQNESENQYANQAKEIFEQSKILSIVPKLLDMAQVKELVPIMKEVEVKKDKSISDYLMLNEIYERLGEPEKQISTLQEAVQAASHDPRPLLLLAVKQLDTGKRDEAQNLFKTYLEQADAHTGRAYLVAYALALAYPTTACASLIAMIWGLAFYIRFRNRGKDHEMQEIKVGLPLFLFLTPLVLAFRFWQTGKALPFGALLIFVLAQLFIISKPYLSLIYRPVLNVMGRIVYFAFNGIHLAKKLDRISTGWRALIAFTTLFILGAIAPTIEIADLKYSVIAIGSLVFYATLGSIIVTFLRSRTSLLSSLRWIAVAATFPFLVSYIISNWNSLGVPLMYARTPTPKAIDSLLNYLIFWSLSLVFALHLGKIIAGALIQPIKEIIQKVALIERGHFEAKVSILSKDEIGHLSHAVNRMANGLERKERIEKTFRQYIDKQIAERILDGCETEVRIEGQSVNAVVMFADIRGFTSLSEQIAPEEVVKFLNAFFERMVKIVQKHGGVVDKFIGDNLMAVWGVPYGIERAEESAVRAALEMLKEMQFWNDELQKLGKPQIGIGVGINSGRVIAGSLGSSDHMEYTVIGDVVNTAQRAESIAQKQELLITDETYQKVKDLITATAKEPVKVKGKEKLQVFWSVLDIQGSKQYLDAA